jgi:hypothetical protein
MIGIVIYNMLGFSLPGNMAGSVQNPKRNFPLAMLISIVLIILNYFLPVLLVSAVPLPALQGTPRWSEWQLGYFSLAAQQVLSPPTPPAPQFTRHRLPTGCRKLVGRLDQRQLRAGVVLLSGGQRRSHRPQPARHVGVGFFPCFFRFVVGQVGFLPPLFSECSYADVPRMYGTPWAASLLVTVLSAVL